MIEIPSPNFSLEALNQQAQTDAAQRAAVLAAATHLRVPLFRGKKARYCSPELFDITKLFIEPSQAADPKNAKPKNDGWAVMSYGELPTLRVRPDVGTEPRHYRKGFSPSQMVLLALDIDDGNLAADAIVPKVQEFFGADTVACIYSTASSTPEAKRWRIMVPFSAAVGVETWLLVAEAFKEYMLEMHRIVLDASMERATQVAFTPNVFYTAERKDGSIYATRDPITGEPLHFEHIFWGAKLFDAVGVLTPIAQTAMDIVLDNRKSAAAEAEAQRQLAEQKAAERQAQRQQQLANGGDGMTPVERFNAQHDTAALLLKHGYTQSPDKASDWRSRYQNSGSYATLLREDGTWFSMSGSDAANGLGTKQGDGVGGDAFDLFVHFEHGGNYGKAVASLAPKADVGVFGGVPMPEGYGPADVLIPFGAAHGGVKRYKLQTPAEFMSRPPAEWVLKDIMPRRGVMTVYGQSGSGKTFLVLDLLLTILDPSRQDWCGERIRNRPAAVVYLALEGASGVRSRLKAWEQDNDGRTVPDNFHPQQDSFNFTQPADVQGLIDSVRERYPQGNVIVVVDTQAKATVGADEQTAKDMGVVFAAAERIAQGIDGLCVTVTHAGKDLAKGVRGSSSQTGAADLIMLVTREGDVRSWEITKNKDGAEDKAGFFSLDTVRIGTDSDGEPIEAAVVVHEGKPQALRPKRIGKSGQIGIDAFHLARSRSGGDCVGLEALRDAFYEKHSGDNLPAKRQAFNRALKALTDSKTLVESRPGFYVVPMGETAAPFTGIQPPLMGA